MYDSDTLNGSVGSLGAESLACFGCHDGASAIDNIANLPGDLTTWTNGSALSGYALLDADLSNDHPVAITYDPVGDTGLTEQTAAETAGMQFFGAGGNVVECASCHDVHGTVDNYPAFLRATPEGSVICLACHSK